MKTQKYITFIANGRKYATSSNTTDTPQTEPAKPDLDVFTHLHEDMKLASFLLRKAQVQFKRANFHTAEILFGKALHITHAQRGSENEFCAHLIHCLGQCLLKLRRFGEADCLFQEALRLRNKLALASEDLTATLNALGQTRALRASTITNTKHKRALLTNAEIIYKKAIELAILPVLEAKEKARDKYVHPDIEKMEEENAKNLLRPMSNLAQLYTEQRKYARAAGIYEQMLDAIVRLDIPLKDKVYADCINNYAAAMRKAKMHKDAIELLYQYKNMLMWEDSIHPADN